jgi:hypothetical protein
MHRSKYPCLLDHLVGAASSGNGMERPSALAVLRLTVISIFVTCCTGSHKATYAVQQVSAAFGPCLAIAAPGQAHREHRTLARLAHYCHVTAHHACELAGDGEAKPCAAVMLGG